jgi:DNA mismatch repair ATPase MutS
VCRGARVLAATHDAELLALLEGAYTPHYFTEEVSAGALRFDYVLRHGRGAPRNALAVLAMVGFPEDVIEDAREAARGAVSAAPAVARRSDEPNAERG